MFFHFYRLNAFLEGFYDIIPKRLISIFNEQELELLISGLPNVDIEDLKANTEYHKYNANSLQVYSKILFCLTIFLNLKLNLLITNIVYFIFRFNGSGEHYEVSIKQIGLNFCNLLLELQKCHFKVSLL